MLATRREHKAQLIGLLDLYPHTQVSDAADDLTKNFEGLI